MEDLKDRIQKASLDFRAGKASMRIPPQDTDVDVVLDDCLQHINDLEQQLDEAHKSRASFVEYHQSVEGIQQLEKVKFKSNDNHE